MKLSTKLLDNLCRMEKKTTVLGGGVALFDKQANIDFFSFVLYPTVHIALL